MINHDSSSVNSSADILNTLTISDQCPHTGRDFSVQVRLRLSADRSAELARILKGVAAMTAERNEQVDAGNLCAVSLTQQRGDQIVNLFSEDTDEPTESVTEERGEGERG